MEYTLKTLKNGLRLILVPRKATEVVTVLVMFKVGSRQEDIEIAGISHVLEHMHYKGTKKRPTGFSVAEFIESIGGEHNAFTGKEYTGYYAKIMPVHLEEGFDFLSDNLLNAKIEEVELEREKGVIIQEINMYEDLPMQMVGSHFEQVVFGDNALGREIIGFKKSVSAVTREKLFNYKKKYYQAKNTVVVLAGNFGEYSENQLEKLVDKYFKFENGPVEKTLPALLNEKKGYFLEDRKTEQTHLVIGFKTVSINHPDFFALDLLSVVLGGSMSSRMFSEVREKRGLAYSVKSDTDDYSESGAIMTQAGVGHDKLYEATRAILGEYKKIKQKLISKEELAKVKEIVLGKMLIRIEDSEEIAFHYACETLLAEKILTHTDLRKIYQRITADDIMRVAKKYLVPEKIGIAVIGPKLQKQKIINLIDSFK